MPVEPGGAHPAHACGDRDRSTAGPGDARPGQRTRNLPGFSPGRVSSSISRCSELDFEQIVPASNSHPPPVAAGPVGEGVSPDGYERGVHHEPP